MAAPGRGNRNGPPARRPRSAWPLLGATIAVAFIAIPAWLEASAEVPGNPPPAAVWVPSVLGAIGSALAGAYLERWLPLGKSDDRSTTERRLGNDLPPPIEHFVGYSTERARIRRLFARFPRTGWRRPLTRPAWNRRTYLAPLVIVITGGPGTGKSQLAIRVARTMADRFPDGVRWVDLQGDKADYAEDDLQVEPTVAVPSSPSPSRPSAWQRLARILRRPSVEEEPEQVGMDGPRLGTTAPRTVENLLTGLLASLGDTPRVPRGQLVQTWRDLTDGQRLLLVLENAEDPEQLRKLLPNSSRSAVIVTSRLAFDDPGMEYQTVELTGFSEEEGLELLDRLAPVTGSRAERQAERARRSEIVRRCHRLPLALGLCGRLLTPPSAVGSAELLSQLRHADQTPLVHAPRGFPASFTVIFQSCRPAQRLLLRRMAAIDMAEIADHAAAALTNLPRGETARMLEDLQARFLLESIGRADDGVQRYRLRQLVRDTLRELRPADFALPPDEIVAWGKEPTHAARHRLLLTYTWLAERAAEAMVRPDEGFPQPPRSALPGLTRLELTPPSRPRAWLGREREVLLGCVWLADSDGHLELGWRIARAFSAMCQALRAHWTEWEQAIRAQCDLAYALGDAHALGMALLDTSEISGGQGAYERGVVSARRAGHIFALQRSDPRWRARAWRALGVNLHRRGDVDTAKEELVQARDVFAEHGERWWLARTQCDLADLHDHLGNHRTAEELLRDARESFAAEGDADQRDLAQLRLAEVLAHQGRQLNAWYMLEEVRRRFADEGEHWYLARCLRAIGGLDSRQLTLQYTDCHLAFHPDRALRRHDLVESGYIRTTNREGHPHTETERHAIRERIREELDQRAREWLGEYAEEVRAHFQRPARSVRARRGDWSPRARIAMLDEAIELLERMGDVWGVHRTRLTLGRVLLREGRHQAGEHELNRAAVGFDELGDVWWSARTHRITAEELLETVLRSEPRPDRVVAQPHARHDVRAVTPWERRIAKAALAHAELAHAAYRNMANHVGQLRSEILLARVLRVNGEPNDEVLPRLRAAANRARHHGEENLARQAKTWRELFERNTRVIPPWRID